MSAAIGGGLTTYELFDILSEVGPALLLISSIAALVSLILRLHRAWGDERQHLKWFLYATLPASVSFSFILVIFSRLYFPMLTFLDPFLPFQWFFTYINTYYVPVISLLFVPVFTFIAILRYHLYDIDVVINRTLVYGSLSACVVGIYVLVVVALGCPIPGARQPRHLALGYGICGCPLPAASDEAPTLREQADVRRAR